MILVVVFQTIQSVATLTLPTLNADIIDNIVDKGPNSYIWQVGAVMLGVTFVQVAFADRGHVLRRTRRPWASGATSAATCSTP